MLSVDVNIHFNNASSDVFDFNKKKIKNILLHDLAEEEEEVHL